MGNKISSIYKMKSRLHARILTVVHAEAVYTLKILPIGIFSVKGITGITVIVKHA